MKTKTILVAVLCASQLLLAQSGDLYDIHLKSGSIIRGKVVELSSEKVKIEIGGNVISEFNMGEVEKVVPAEAAQPSAEKKERIPYVRRKGFFNDTEFGFLIGSGNADDKFNTAISFQTSSGYKVNPYFRIGAGTGVDHYTDYDNTFISVFGRVAGDMLNNWVTPVYFLDEGYGFVFEEDKTDSGAEITNSKGGWMMHAGIGVKFYTPSKASFSLLAGYKMQKSQRDYQYDYYEYTYHEDRSYSRLTFGMGVGF